MAQGSASTRRTAPTTARSKGAIQAAIADQITAQVFTYIDVKGLTAEAVDVLAQRDPLPLRVADQLQAFAVPIANGVQSFTRDQVGKIVQSDAFADAWVQANRAAHAELVKASPARAPERSRSKATP